MDVGLVLVPVDFSECSATAMAYAKAMAQHWKAQYVGVHVVDAKMVNWIAEYNREDHEKVRERLTNQAHQAFRRFVSDTNTEDLFKETIVSYGSPFQEIAIKARELQADLVLIGGYGSRGTGQIDEIFFGSTVEKVVRLLPCPVLCVPMGWPFPGA